MTRYLLKDGEMIEAPVYVSDVDCWMKMEDVTEQNESVRDESFSKGYRTGWEDLQERIEAYIHDIRP